MACIIMSSSLITGYICYDDGCHLRKFSQNPIRRNQSKTSEKIANLEIVVDKMHFKGHVDTWCRQHCDPNKHRHLDKVCLCFNNYCGLSIMILAQVDTEVCEQTFSWLSRYARITRHMNKEHFLFYLLFICDLHNRKILDV
jgi:hypothetical protein